MPLPIRCTDPYCRYDYGHHTGVTLNVWWPSAGSNNQPRVVTRNTSVLVLVSSEWRDSNPRPPGPKPGALPSCATFRVAGLLFEPQITSANVIGPKSKSDAVSHWKGDFQWVRYLFVVEYKEGLVGMLFSRRQNHTQTPDRGANVDFRSATPYAIPRSRCPAHPLDQSGRS